MSSKTGIPIWQVDAFSDRPFAGNPAAVCILDDFPDDQWMQSVASEMNLSETSFVVPTAEANSFRLRWFTPATEVDLCGHATLASAHTLIEQNQVDTSLPIRFQTRSGELRCVKAGSRITLDFPATPAAEDVDPIVAEQVCQALGLREATVLQSQFDLLVVVEDSSIVESLLPNLGALAEIKTRGVMVTAACRGSDIDFVSRFFAPRCGINEDPVTGSAHCCLAPYWANRLEKTSLVGYQASSRGGRVSCEIAGDRVHLTGTAVTVLEGRLLSKPTMETISTSTKITIAGTTRPYCG
ncbi:PhzF family phenazine biosynthesis protein [Neorhodopirellula pilleata]|uniref:Putative isomerase YddE n=1 Tax=Neorhodopirellula pilleata TaxID=2714738 RepID=A0A5C6AQ73_9BACT|nr:PhzF family phenazine biosynthesis protein [Neorhodopirellula pilleata]TWU01379.1 putative isomerase YddE [Neorhodopirellula pilleata]